MAARKKPAAARKTVAKKSNGKAIGQIIVLPALNIKTVSITLIGDSPLIVNAWSPKAREMMKAKQGHEALPAKGPKIPFQDFLGSMYWLTERPADATLEDVAKAKFGFPAIGFKGSAINACSFIEGVTKVAARGVFHINGTFVTIDSDVPIMREDFVRIGMGTADLRYRGEFDNWRVTFNLRYNATFASVEQIFNLYNHAGFHVGVGERRPQCKSGDSFGMFHVATEKEAA